MCNLGHLQERQFEANKIRASDKKERDELKIKWFGHRTGISFAKGKYHHYLVELHPEGHILFKREATKEELESINGD